MSTEREKLQGLPPVAGVACRTLVLGSMPGAASLAKQQYYGHPRNHFWRLLYAVFEAGDGLNGSEYPEPDDSYGQRLSFALSHGIALWDVLEACERKGSLDTDIRRPEANDFPSFFRAYPAIDRVFFNGKAAGELFHKQVAPRLKEQGLGDRIRCAVLPSSSPAHTVRFDEKLAAWRQLRDAGRSEMPQGRTDDADGER
ncbi:Uracil DNA glycosylase superfamily protein [Paenibacillus konkukensis]|uniref:Uracil DNA glycosylase superfamily protein n=1 Tax=Paenibacillus konkukensis TaxID=2020716 RepID=A0ABY4RQP7_9BACL|nr:DNA-deoxyinosine glycosylase [Paenibacillus konkukensis]UQZ84807.1 Uracil DNA glycosylase superfamily protein [Paenibacillus konkukensis]